MRAGTALFVALLTASLAACDSCKPSTSSEAGPSASSTPPPIPSVAWEVSTKTDAITAGKAVITKYECVRCHTIDDVAAPQRPFHCTGCHQWMKGLKPGDKTYVSLVEKWGEPIISRYLKNIYHLQRVPNLTGLGRRMRGDFIKTFLDEPFDQRPVLEESMFRHQLDADEIKSVVRYFVAMSDAPDPYAAGYTVEMPAKPDAARLAKGKELFKTRGCNICHTFGNVDFGISRETIEGARPTSDLAPNLRFARARTRPDVIVTWMMAPQTVLPGTLMPPLVTSREDAETLRDYLFFGDPELKPAPAPITYDFKAKSEPGMMGPIKLLDRKVPYIEMKEKTLGRICVHCHMNDYEKDTGPGNKGGFGYKGIGLAIRTYETMVGGAIGPDGKRYSIFANREGESVPPVLQAMLRRRTEEQRDHVAAFNDYERPHYPKDIPGMPIALPSMSDEEIALLATWIAQGCEGPTDVSGKAGVNDGYLVPDGPIQKNKGCELRPLETPRPKWAVDVK